jgi:CRISPR/Cas system-associated exonuclease Cas4 (RecB family)
MKKAAYVTASEIGDYVYCKRAWWLKMNGYSKTNSQMLAGTKAHNSLYKLLETIGLLRIIAFSLIALAILILIIIFLFHL